MEALVHQRKSLVLILVKQRKKCCLCLHYNHDNSCGFVNRKKKYKLKADNKYRNFPTQLFLGQISTKFGESEEVL